MTATIKMYELPCLDTRKSFYGKAHVKIEGDTATLQSYSTDVARYNFETGKFTRLWDGYSATTMRHVNSFICHLGIDHDGGKAAWDNMEVSK